MIYLLLSVDFVFFFFYLWPFLLHSFNIIFNIELDKISETFFIDLLFGVLSGSLDFKVDHTATPNPTSSYFFPYSFINANGRVAWQMDFSRIVSIAPHFLDAVCRQHKKRFLSFSSEIKEFSEIKFRRNHPFRVFWIRSVSSSPLHRSCSDSLKFWFSKASWSFTEVFLDL